MTLERVHKIIARAGVASRRKAEELMREGRVTVNGRLVERPGEQADPERDAIKVNGKLLATPGGQPRYLAMFKPRRTMTSLEDPEGRPTITDLLRRHRIKGRVYPVGRLDWDADGLVLLMDDGELANRIMQPASHVRKVYRVKVKGRPSDKDLDRVRRGLVLEPGQRTLPAEVRVEQVSETTTWLRVALVEGKQNQIKRMFARIGHPVRKLRRISIGPIGLGKLKPGDVRELTQREVDRLRDAVEKSAPRA
jgi:23S rRNA pseudouridine2605 synthase